jgi:hypothetical protein
VDAAAPRPHDRSGLQLKNNKEHPVGRTFDVISPAPRDAWRKALAADRNALLSHTPEWLDTICAVGGFTDASRLYVWPSGRQLVLPMVGKRVGGFTVAEDSLPDGWGFGGLVGADVGAAEAADVMADLRARKILRQHICPSCLQGDAWRAAVPADAAGVTTRNAHAIDLDGGLDAVWKRFSDNARRGIRKAEKQGLEVECDTTGRLLGELDTLWQMSVRRWATQRHEPVWLGWLRGRRLNPESRWKQMAQRMPGGVAIWVARHQGEPVAATAILRGPNDHYTRGAMHKDLAGPTRANFLLHWLAIQDACKRGAGWYQMGQSGPPGDPVARFKENFGARAYTFPEVQLDMVPIGGVTAFPRTAAQWVLDMSRRRHSDAA